MSSVTDAPVCAESSARNCSSEAGSKPGSCEHSNSTASNLLPSVSQSKQESGDFSLSSLDTKTANQDSNETNDTGDTLISVVHSGQLNTGNTGESQRQDSISRPLDNIEIIEAIYRRTQSTLIQCLQQENKFLKSHSTQASAIKEGNKGPLTLGHSTLDLNTGMPYMVDPLAAAEPILSTAIATLQNEVQKLSESNNSYKLKISRLEEQNRSALITLGQESGKLKMLEQVVMDKDTEIHRLLAENLEATRIIAMINKSNRQTPLSSMNATYVSPASSTATMPSTPSRLANNKQLEAVTRYSMKIEDKLRDAEAEVKACKDTIQEKDSKIANLTDMLEKKMSETEELTRKLESTCLSLEQHEETASRYKSRLRESSRALEQAKRLLREKDDELKDAVSIVTDIKRDTGNMVASLDIKDLRISELENKLLRKSKEAKKLQSLKLKMEAQEAQLLDAKENIDSLQAQITAKDLLVETLNNTVELRDASIKDLEQQLQTVKSSTTTYGLAAVSAEKMLLESKQHEKKLAAELEECKANYRQQISENSVLKTQLNEINQLEEQRLKHTAQLMSSFKAKDDEIARLFAVITEWEKKYTEASEQNNTHGAEIQRLKQSLLDKDSELVDFIARNKETQHENARLRVDIGELDTIRQELVRYSTKCNSLVERISALSHLFFASKTVQAFLSSPQFQSAASEQDAALSPEDQALSALEASIQSFLQDIVSDSNATAVANQVLLVDGCVGTDDPVVHHSTCGSASSTSDAPYLPGLPTNPVSVSTQEIQTDPVSPPLSNTAQTSYEIKQLTTTITMKDKELVELRDLIIHKNRQIRQLLQGDDFA